VADIVTALIYDLRNDTTVATTLGYSTNIGESIDAEVTPPAMSVAHAGGMPGVTFETEVRVEIMARAAKRTDLTALHNRLRVKYHGKRGINVGHVSYGGVVHVVSGRVEEPEIEEHKDAGLWEAQWFIHLLIASSF